LQQVTYKDLGRIAYQEAWDFQQERLKEVIDIKMHNRHLSEHDVTRKSSKHYLLFCDHPPVYTLGKSGSMDHLLLNEEELKSNEIEFYKINRGGDITFHGPGQIIGYPIFDLECFFTDVHKYVRYLEEAVIRTLNEFDIDCMRLEGYTGVWLPATKLKPNRKICAIGVHLSRWVTMHGFAFNVNTDLGFFNNIIPCGINDAEKSVTSLATELGKEVDIEAVKKILMGHFASLFGYQYEI